MRKEMDLGWSFHEVHLRQKTEVQMDVIHIQKSAHGFRWDIDNK